MGFFLTCVADFGCAFFLASILFRLFPPIPSASEIIFPSVFWFTSFLLLSGSVILHLAAGAVRMERQRTFRRSLVSALVLGTLFVAAQTYGISCLIRNQSPTAGEIGVNAFATCFTAVHAMHFMLAQMLLIWVTLHAFADRYDHEYFWGVTICEWFWHALGLIWMAILVVFGVSV